MLNYIRRSAVQTPFDRPADMPAALHELLMSRGIDSPEAAERFLNPDARSLHDPFLLNDMVPATELIRAAVEARKPICVYGDYDADGVCASAILYLYLKSLGADVRVHLPDRHRDGYGLNETAVREIAGWAGLMVTVDCGISAVELVGLAKSLGLPVVVTDHHRPGEALPDCPVVNPLLNGYPFPFLCGAGVAWKLVWALSGQIPMDLVDLAALATVADVVSLTEENRAIVALGLQSINRHPRPGVAALIQAAGKADKPVTSGVIGFQLGPRLNASGRLDTAMRAFDLVTAEDPRRAEALAEELDQLNSQRKSIQDEIIQAAEAQLEGFDFVAHRAVIIAGKDWNVGVVGLAASKLVEKYHCPAIVLSDQGDKLTGSCRSIEGVDIFAALTACGEHLTRYGGHVQAAGLTLPPENLRPFIDAMDAWLNANIPPEVFVPGAVYDAQLPLDAVNLDLVAALRGLEPTGEGNKPPVFRATAQVVSANPTRDGKHLQLTLAQGGHSLQGIAFQQGPRTGDFPGGSAVDVLFAPELNDFFSPPSVELNIKALANADANARIASKLGDEFPLQCDFLTEIIYNTKIDPSKPPVPRVGAEALADWLAASPQGTLMIAGDLAAASRALELGPCDLYLGCLPNDPRGFNALCVCPRPGPIPASYRRTVLLGAPAESFDGPGEVFRLDAPAEWTRAIPDIGQMRQAYLALKALSVRPLQFTTLRQLSQLAADEAGLDALTALLSLLVIEDMGLCRYDCDARPARIARLPCKKADPERSAVWKAMQRWKAEL